MSYEMRNLIRYWTEQVIGLMFGPWLKEKSMSALFNLDNGDRFEWKGRKYTLVRIDEDGKATVIEDGVPGEQNFNPYADVKRCE